MQRWDSGLSALQKAFVREFVELGTEPRLASLAACRAGSPAWKAPSTAAKFLASPKVLAAIPLYREAQAVWHEPTPGEVVATLARVMRDPLTPAKTRVASAKTLAELMGIGPEAVAKLALLEVQRAQAERGMDDEAGGGLVVIPPESDDWAAYADQAKAAAEAGPGGLFGQGTPKEGGV